MNIICATDFSSNAQRAADAAVSITDRFKGSLTLVHAVNRPAVNLLPEPMRDTWSGEATVALRKLARKISHREPDVATKLLVGVPDEAINAHTRETAPDLLILGSLGERSIDEWIIGSTAERLADASPVPILLVRDPAPFRAWSEKDTPLRILFAYDFDETSNLALAYLAAWAKVGATSVTVAHIDWPPEEYSRLGIHRPMSVTSNDPQVQSILERDLRRKVLEHFGAEPDEVRVAPSFGRSDETLLQMIDLIKPDLVVCGTHQRTGLDRFWRGSVSLELARHAPTNILLVPSSRETTNRVSPHREVLALTDFSPAGDEAVRRAYALLPAGGTVHLVHVTEPRHIRSDLGPNYESQTYSAEDHLSQVKELEDRLRQQTPANAERFGLRTRIAVIEDGDVPGAICQAAERLGVDAISMGARGHGKLEKIIHGSVTETVLARATRPVFVVKAPRE